MSNQKLLELLQEDYGEYGEFFEYLDEIVFIIPKDKLLDIAARLKSTRYDFDFLANLTAIEYPEKFTVVYNFRSLKKKYSLQLRVEIDKNKAEVPSIISFWRTADWQEREVYDLMGITFLGHYNLKRILLTESFQGHPLRKDYMLPDRRKAR